MCAQLLICMWTCMHVDQPAHVCDGRRLRRVKHLCVCRGRRQLRRRPSIMHASTLLAQLWSQPWAEVGALYHAAARFFKAGKRNRVPGGETRNVVPGRRRPTMGMGRGDEAAFVSVCHIWMADFKLREPSRSSRRGGAGCMWWGSYKVNLSLSPLLCTPGKRSQRTTSAAKKMRKITGSTSTPRAGLT